MSLYNEYESYVLRYMEEYGQNTIVLYRCGSFYEIYSIDDGLVHMKKICELLNIQMSKRNKSLPEVSRTNCLMAGFPMYTLQKFVNILVNENYTVVIVDQVSEPPKPRRAVTSIVSPGTDINNIVSPDANVLMSIFFDETIDFRTRNKLLVIGIAAIDISTGNVKLYEAASTSTDYSIALDETYRIIQFENPKEVILIGSKIQNIHTLLELDGRCVHDIFEKVGSDVLKVDYQSRLLKKVYPQHGMLSVIEYLDLEKYMIATASFVYLIQFVFKHNENALAKLKKPEVVLRSNNLVLSYNAVKHLNILSAEGNNNNTQSLLSILNKCQTAIGKRRFKETFLTPLTNADAINKRYDTIEFLLHDKLFIKVRKLLDEVYDLERLHRRIQLNLLHPCEIMHIQTSISAMNTIFETSGIKVMFGCDNLSVQIHDMLAFCKNTIDINEASKYNQDNIATCFFKRTDMYQSLWKLQDKVDTSKAYFTNLLSSLNGYIGVEHFKLDYNQQDGFHLIITAKRYKDIEQMLEQFVFVEVGETFTIKDVCCKITSSKTCFKLFHPSFTKVNKVLETIQSEFAIEAKSNFIAFLEQFDELYSESMQQLVRIIGDIDVYCNNAKNAIENNYVRPSLVQNQSKTAYIEAIDMRHPIIERITETGYVPNDVCLGAKDIKGMLLYGTNMVGKSAYMKSIGISIIMAQAGMFVPASKMVFWPFTQVFTRIPSGDDLFKSQSTFAVEISELRNILKRADKNSLVIGDELASGTESVSAVAIVASGVIELGNKDSCFVFATHLHDLTSLKKINELESLKVFHLSVEFDEKSNKLIYNRKIQPGQGSTLYGLEVCRALDMGSQFMVNANEFRRELLNQSNDLVSKKKSVYNAQHVIDTCSVCGQSADEVHHIKHQADADENGFVGSYHKNAKYNLMNVCEKCHDLIHAGKMFVNGYVQTSHGVELAIDVVQQEDNNKTLTDKLKRMRMELKMTYIQIQQELKRDNIDISTYKIKKLLS
jgi:DNA mismatch repair protein MutS